MDNHLTRGVTAAPLEPLFGQWLQDLAPNLPSPARVVQERVLYRSAEWGTTPKYIGWQGDDMEVALQDFQLPIESQSDRQENVESREKEEQKAP